MPTRAHRVSGLVLVALLAACAGSADSIGPYGGTNGGNTAGNTGNNGGYGNPTGNSDNPNTVVISNSSFSPDTLVVTAGTTVTFQNNDAATHTATADGGGFDSGQIPGGRSATHTFSTAGSFAYHCAIHSFMHAVIKVQ